jgi:ornithine cyclodeaminase/alanine dehydrogenase-like protein (mu-crystallin family)
VLLIDNHTVAKVLTMETTLAALEDAYRQHVAGEAVCRPRIDIQIPTPDPNKVYRWGTMEGGSMHGYFAIRVKSDIIYEREYNGATTQEKYCMEPGTYCGLILLMSVANGEPLAILNDGELQHMRVGADGGLGVKYAARRDINVVGMLGSGGQARSHMAAFMQVRPGIKRLQVYSPTRENRERFGAEMREQYGIEVKVCDAPEQVYQDADILAALTDSAVPVIDARHIRPGMHIVNIGGGGYIGGGGTPGRSLVDLVDLYLRFGNVTAPWGHPEYGIADEYLTWAAEPASRPLPKLKHSKKRGHGVLAQDRMVTFADIVNRDLATARTSDAQISYSERGNLQGHQFWSVAGRVYEEVKAQGLGRELPTEWFLQDIRN